VIESRNTTNKIQAIIGSPSVHRGSEVCSSPTDDKKAGFLSMD
jgi:hypothetical protein